MGVEKAELKTVQEAQKADPVLTKYFKYPKLNWPIEACGFPLK